MIAKETVQAIIEEILSGTDKFLVEVAVHPTNMISVYLDSDSSLTIQDCQEINRAIENKLNRDKEDFDLTVSSSGIDRPLKMLRQYKKNIGKELKVVTIDGKTMTCVLVKVGTNSVELEHLVKQQKKVIKRDNTCLPLAEIKTAKLIVKIRK